MSYAINDAARRCSISTSAEVETEELLPVHVAELDVKELHSHHVS